MKIYAGADHAGYELKDFLVGRLAENGYEVEDLGTNSGRRADYPDYASAVARKALENSGLGVLVCGTGIGISIAANKIRGIRAAHCADPLSARLAREHNDANIITLGSRIIGPELAWAVVEAWLGAEFQGGRHAERLALIAELEAEAGRA